MLNHLMMDVPSIRHLRSNIDSMYLCESGSLCLELDIGGPMIYNFHFSNFCRGIGVHLRMKYGNASETEQEQKKLRMHSSAVKFGFHHRSKRCASLI